VTLPIPRLSVSKSTSPKFSPGAQSKTRQWLGGAAYPAHVNHRLDCVVRGRRKHGPIGVLFDVIASTCTPQTRQLLDRLQREEAESLGVTPYIRQLVKPLQTRWNSYFSTFVRATELHGPIDSYIESKLEEHSAATAPSRRRKNREQLPSAQPRSYIREGGLSGKDWATITEYIRLLKAADNTAATALFGKF
jgi:hypothetical protein